MKEENIEHKILEAQKLCFEADRVFFGFTEPQIAE